MLCSRTEEEGGFLLLLLPLSTVVAALFFGGKENESGVSVCVCVCVLLRGSLACVRSTLSTAGRIRGKGADGRWDREK